MNVQRDASSGGGTVPVLLTACDEAFAGPASLALISAARATSRPVHCVLLADGIAADTLARVHAAFASAGVGLEVVSVPAEKFDGFFVREVWSRTTLARLFLSSVAPHIRGRVLYLDADTLTVAPLDGLLDADLAGCAFGAVADPCIPFVSSPAGVLGWRRLGLSPALRYFNAGLLLIDTDRWRAVGIEERCLDLLRDFPEEALFPDQGALNAVAAGRWLPLDPRRWNVFVPAAYTIGLRGWELSRDGVRRVEKAAVYHYAGTRKPWHRDYPPSPARDRYLAAWERWTPAFHRAEPRSRLAWHAGRLRGEIR